MEAIYIKHHDESDSLTHYGVKGMKWRKHKIRRDLYNIEGDYTGHTFAEAKTKTEERVINTTNLIDKTRAAANHAKKQMRDKKSTTSARRSISKTLSSFGKSYLAKSKKAVSKGRSVINSINRIRVGQVGHMNLDKKTKKYKYKKDYNYFRGPKGGMHTW